MQKSVQYTSKVKITEIKEKEERYFVKRFKKMLDLRCKRKESREKNQEKRLESQEFYNL